jgi:uncharacterized protein YecE (DUF72 family)
VEPIQPTFALYQTTFTRRPGRRSGERVEIQVPAKNVISTVHDPPSDSPSTPRSDRERRNANLRAAHIGCSGWNYRSWRGSMYPDRLAARRWLQAYAERFSTVEVNATFYRLIERSAVQSWAQQTPSNFIFAVKASRYLTHVRRLSGITDGVARFSERIAPLAEAHKLGPWLWQLPATFRRDDARLASALDALPPGRHAFEFRDPSWFSTDVYAQLRAHDAALVIGDHPGRPFQTHVRTAGWRYVRFHYGARGRRGNYSERELEAWAKRLHRWRSREEIFVYFNNDWEAFAPRNALWLHERLARMAGESHA